MIRSIQMLCLLIVAGLFMFGPQEVSAYYSTQQGRFISRDPIGSLNQTASQNQVSINPRIGQSTFTIGRDLISEDAVAVSSQAKDQFVVRGLNKNTPYVDGPNLYQYVRSNPQIYVDTFGLMSRNEWDKCCKDTGEAARQLAHFRSAAMAIDGYDYGRFLSGEVGCGWCANGILDLLDGTQGNTPKCWDYKWYAGTKYMIGIGWLGLPDVVFQHQFVAFRKNIDGMAVGDAYNSDSPVFDGWGGLPGNIRRKCKFSEGTVGDYRSEWKAWRDRLNEIMRDPPWEVYVDPIPL